MVLKTVPIRCLFLGGSFLVAAQFFYSESVFADTGDSVVIPLIERVTPNVPGPLFQEGANLAPLARATIFVRDIEESLKLYRDILGLTPMFDNLWKGSGINAIMGTQGRELRATVLMAGQSVQGNLGIYQLYNATESVSEPIQSTDTRIGDFAIVFPTNDIWRLTDEITSSGYPIVSPPVSLIERDEYAVQPVEMMFRDRDGVLVNLVQAGVKKNTATAPE
jgi:catechol 2,3-dioxygenase-like lactoylglutathione lyase family enzyme